MLAALGMQSRQELIDQAVPQSIRLEKPPTLPDALNESAALAQLQDLMDQNQVHRSFIGQGYYGTRTPGVIQRNILENPSWYTAYTPYQAEIAQGRLEALLNFQTMVCDLTGLPVANASLLDEGTAAAEAISVAASAKPKGKVVFVSDTVHPQTLDVVRTRMEPLGLKVVTGDHADFSPADQTDFFAALVQYPATDGSIHSFADFTEKVHQAGGLLIAATDLLALTLLTPPGEWGADIAIGSAQRFGVPFGFGGPHAAFISCSDALKRKLPGRLVGVSQDARGRTAYRLSLQTREQHIRRDKATSNICTAQVLLAVMAAMYAVYHGPHGLKAIAKRVQGLMTYFIEEAGLYTEHAVFDTIVIETGEFHNDVLEKAGTLGFRLREFGDWQIGVSFDETTTQEEVDQLVAIFAEDIGSPGRSSSVVVEVPEPRTSPFLTHPAFNSYQSETEMLRYIKRLESKDLALTEAMIPLGSCTMKLNATSEMVPLSWPTVANIHPFAPESDSIGYRQMLAQLSDWLAELTGFEKVSLQPNAGSQGEFAGLLAIRRYHHARGDQHRIICLIPTSAHGTNPASAVMAGMKVVPVNCDDEGNIDPIDFKEKIEKNQDQLAALMVTYPSTHGVFEEGIKDLCAAIHNAGGLVYLDGANLNAQVGLTTPAAIGADVCHLNLHKTFCIPHGGGGPGVGPIGVNEKLAPYLPGHRLLDQKTGPTTSAPYGSASINVISWMYLVMMGTEGLTHATETAILSANYLATQLQDHFPVLYRGRNNLVAHECILDLRPLAKESGVTVEDVAKRLSDYGFHAPTMSWPVPGTLMIEPTESESLAELDRFVKAMVSIRQEIQDIIDGTADRDNNVLKNAPHPAEAVTADDWPHPYSRQQAAYPVPGLRDFKFWPAIARIDNVAGDRNLVCTCPSIEDYR